MVLSPVLIRLCKFLLVLGVTLTIVLHTFSAQKNIYDDRTRQEREEDEEQTILTARSLLVTFHIRSKTRLNSFWISLSHINFCSLVIGSY